MEKKRFRKGNIVKCTGNIVLVTGSGSKEEGYPCFAGVVIYENKNDDSENWSFGMYSNTWNTEAFRKIKLNLSKIIQDNH